MEVPRHLYHTNVYYANQPGEGRIVEAGDPEAAILMANAGMLISDEDAQRLGITEYLAQHPQPPAEPEAKAVEQATVEDKAVTPEETKAEEPAAEPSTEPSEPSTLEGGRSRGRGRA